MADGPYDVPQIAGSYEQEREYYIRRILERFPSRSTDPALLYGDPKLEFLRLVNEGLISAGGTDLEEVQAVITAATKDLASKPTNGELPVGKGELLLSPKDFGAKGDGNTDDTASIQRMFNAAAQYGQIIDFGSSDATYRISGVVEIGSNTIVQGRGAQLIKKDSATESSYAIFCTRSHANAFYGGGGSNIRFNNLRFRGSLPSRAACAFSGHHSDDVQFHGCTFEEMGGTGHIVDLSACQDVVFRDCRFIGATDVNSRAEAIQIDISAAAGISVLDDRGSYSGLPTRRVTIDNCKFLPSVVNGTTYPAPVPLGSHAQWEDKWFEDINFINNTVINGRLHTGTDPVGLLHFSCIDGLTIFNNTFIQIAPANASGRVISVTPASAGVGIGANPNDTSQTRVDFATTMRSKNVSISENKFKGFISAGYDVMYFDNTDVVSVTRNRFENCGSMYDLRSVNGFTAHSNQFVNPPALVSPQIINCNKVTKVSISGELIDCTGATNLAEILYISNNSAQGTVQGNIIIGKAAAGINQIAGSTLTLNNNVLI